MNDQAKSHRFRPVEIASTWSLDGPGDNTIRPVGLNYSPCSWPNVSGWLAWGLRKPIVSSRRIQRRRE